MIFASRDFYLFCGIVLLIYHSLGTREKKYRFLLLASWFFYFWLSPYYLWVIWLLTLIDYLAALQIEATNEPRQRRRWLTLSIVSNLGLLFAFKYTAFSYDTAVSLARVTGVSLPERTWSILLPLGISFHTFQGISYTIDVYRRQIAAVRSLPDYALFVAFFPQMAAGPIVRAVDFLPQMTPPPRPTAQQVGDGIWLFASGLFKKLVIADHLDALFVSPIYDNPSAFSPELQRWATLAWAVQIYCDFSGYTDMARGCAKWFGFELPINFHLPYLATSITEFWRRWHLSLSTWLRDYLYFPLGGSKGHPGRTYFNLIFVFVLCGLWHGATWSWLIYGLINGLLMALHRVYDRAVTGIAWIDTVRRSWPWLLLAWLATALQFLFCLVLVRMASWETGAQLLHSFVMAPLRGSSSAWPPAEVGLLMILGMMGHLAGLLRLNRPLPDVVRLPFAALLLVCVVVYSPGVAKSFIYIHF